MLYQRILLSDRMLRDKKEAMSLLQRAGHQLSGALIPHDGFIHSIRENDSPVKQIIGDVTQSQQFKRWFGKSKAVKKDGSPRVLYHYTDEVFVSFDVRKKRKQSWIETW